MVELNVKRMGHSEWYVLQDERSIRREYWRPATREHGWRPPTDLYETDAAVIVRVEIAGMSENDFSITINDRYLFIRGVRTDEAQRRAFHQMEIPFGEFRTEVELPCPVDVQQASAEYAKGFLLVILPKIRPSRIEISR
jgi:HSP20 family molecular chaperone IbpA